MRKIVLYTLLSVDGVAEAPETLVVDFDAEMNANLHRAPEEPTGLAIALGDDHG